MAQLLEHQGKAVLAKHGIAVPRGRAATDPLEAERIARELGAPTVVKVQSGTTGRAASGGVAFAATAAEARDHAARMLAMQFGQFPVVQVLVEERLDIEHELFVSLSLDDRTRAPMLLFSAQGGSGIEERGATAVTIACDVTRGPDPRQVDQAVKGADLPANAISSVLDAIVRVYQIARAVDARSVEINPLAIVAGGRVVAADCRMTIDDYAVFRQPDLGIAIAREFDHPPTVLERIAYEVEQADHRGTFYFAQLATAAAPGSKGLAGFHGAGGGGSMMAMDAITNEGFTIANFTDTSGNPSSAKVYRAARIILSQPGLVGYFGSGSGVASQEQFWSAYGLSKAFLELSLDIPAVIRLGGNAEDRAVEILQESCVGLPGRVEGYRKTDPPAAIARRFSDLVANSGGRPWSPRPPQRPSFVGQGTSIQFPIRGGRAWLDPAQWSRHRDLILAQASGLLRDDSGRPGLSVDADEFATKDSELIACEIECLRAGVAAFFVELDIPGLEPPSSGT